MCVFFTSPVVCGPVAAPALCVQLGCARPRPRDSAETDAAHTHGCRATALAAYEPPAAETESDPQDPPHLHTQHQPTASVSSKGTFWALFSKKYYFNELNDHYLSCIPVQISKNS